MIADSRLSVGLSNVALIPVGVLSFQSLSNAIKAPLASRNSRVGSCNGCAIPKLPSVGPIARSMITGGSIADNQSTDQDIVARANETTRTEISKNRGRGV